MSFCMNCGRQLGDGEICNCMQMPVQKKKSRKLFIIIPAAVLLVAAVSFLCIFLSGKDNVRTVPSWVDSAFENNKLTLKEVRFDFIEEAYEDDYSIYSISPDGNKMLGVSDDRMFIADIEKKTLTPIVKDLENSVEAESFSSGKHVLERSPRLILRDDGAVWSPDGRYLTFVSYTAMINLRPFDLTLVDTLDGSWRALEYAGKTLKEGIRFPISACFNDEGNKLYYIEYGNRNEALYTLKQYDLEKKEITVLSGLIEGRLGGGEDWGMPYSDLYYYKGDIYYTEERIKDSLRFMKVSEKNGEWSPHEISIMGNDNMRGRFQIADTGAMLMQTETKNLLVRNGMYSPESLFMLLYAESPNSEWKILTTADCDALKVGVGEYTFDTYPKPDPRDEYECPGAVSMSPDGKYALISMYRGLDDYHIMLLNLESFEWKELEEVKDYFGSAPVADSPLNEFRKCIKWVSGNKILVGENAHTHVLELTEER